MAARLPGTSFALLLADEVTQEWVVRGVAGLDGAIAGTRLALAAGLAGRAAAERRVLVAEGEEAAAALPWASPAPGSVLAAPLLQGEGCAGVMLYGRAGGFGEPERRLIESAALQVATAVEGARLHQAMVRLSQTDTLTGVQNRRQLFARLELEHERAARFGEPFALLLVDVDRFRELNEAAGHAAGDAALREVAALLGREVRQVHGVAVARAEAPSAPCQEADAVVSVRPGLAACVAVADCVPLLLAAPHGAAVAAVHAGWRGSLERAAAAGVRALAGAAGVPAVGEEGLALARGAPAEDLDLHHPGLPQRRKVGCWPTR